MCITPDWQSSHLAEDEYTCYPSQELWCPWNISANRCYNANQIDKLRIENSNTSILVQQWSNRSGFVKIRCLYRHWEKWYSYVNIPINTTYQNCQLPLNTNEKQYSALVTSKPKSNQHVVEFVVKHTPGHKRLETHRFRPQQEVHLPELHN